MKVDLINVKKGDKIWTIENGWEKVLSTDYSERFPIETENCCYTINGKRYSEEFPSAFLEYPFKEQDIEKDTLVWFRDSEDMYWMVGYYAYFDNGEHFCFTQSKKSNQTSTLRVWKIVTTENPLL